MKYTIKKHGFSFVLVITDFVKANKLKIGDLVEARLNRVSSGSHPHNKQKPRILQ
jgi:pyruvate/2-oxoacid:ferredoxin oxidoreductase beta subunit